MPPKKATILPGTNAYCTKTDFNFNMTPYKFKRDLLAAAKKALILPGTNDYNVLAIYKMTPYQMYVNYEQMPRLYSSMINGRNPFDFRRKWNRRTILGGG
jgi:hypothetical protein